MGRNLAIGYVRKIALKYRRKILILFLPIILLAAVFLLRLYYSMYDVMGYLNVAHKMELEGQYYVVFSSGVSYQVRCTQEQYNQLQIHENATVSFTYSTLFPTFGYRLVVYPEE